MDYEFTGSGDLKTYGCPEVVVDKYYRHKYEVGSTVFDLFSARKGRLEAIVIEKVFFIPVGGVYGVMYRDTLNARYNEADLVTHDEAIQIATAYLNRKLASVQGAIDALNCQ